MNNMNNKPTVVAAAEPEATAATSQEQDKEDSTSLWHPVRTISIPQEASSSNVVTAIPVSHDSVVLLLDHDDAIAGSSSSSSMICVDWSMQRSWKMLRHEVLLPEPRYGSACTCVNSSTSPNNQVLVVAGGKQIAGNNNGSVTEHVDYLGGSGTMEEGSTTTGNMVTPRWFGSALTLGNHVLVFGGKTGTGAYLSTIDVMDATQLSSNTSSSTTWSVLPTALPCGPVMAPAVVAVTTGTTESSTTSNTTGMAAYILGGYNGHEWTTTCQSYKLRGSSDHIDAGSWDTSIPNMPVPVRLAKAVEKLGQYIIVAGENCTQPNGIVLQCLDLTKKAWIWKKATDDLVSIDSLSIVDNRLYAIGQTPDRNGGGVGTIRAAFTCDLSALDNKHFPDSATATPTSSFASVTPKLRKVKNIQLQGGLSRYSGQMKQMGDAWIPHGQGLEVWADEKKLFGDLQDKNNSYYRGSYKDGYRDGIGEMYLFQEDQLYIGEFQNGSWHGLGRLEIRGKMFSYFGQFQSGERTGYGHSNFRAISSSSSSSRGIKWRMLSYAGHFDKGLAHGEGTVTDLNTGEVVESREFEKEDLLA